MRHVVFYSGGIASYIAAKRVAAAWGKENTVLLFTDTKYEHEDLYRFLDETEARLGCTLVRIADGRTPWEVFRDVKFLGNSQVDPCSRILKRDISKRWVLDNCADPAGCVLYLGLNHDEAHRLERSKRFWSPYRVESPLMAERMSKADMLAECRRDGVAPPELYELGFTHNNCGGFCIKAGHAHFKHLLRVLPEKYAECEAEEAKLRETLGDVAVLRDRRNGSTRPLTLTELRSRSRQDCDYLDWGGCGCFGDIPEEENLTSDHSVQKSESQ